VWSSRKHVLCYGLTQEPSALEFFQHHRATTTNLQHLPSTIQIMRPLPEFDHVAICLTISLVPLSGLHGENLLEASDKAARLQSVGMHEHSGPVVVAARPPDAVALKLTAMRCLFLNQPHKARRSCCNGCIPTANNKFRAIVTAPNPCSGAVRCKRRLLSRCLALTFRFAFRFAFPCPLLLIFPLLLCPFPCL
jgi:hypothetical protein